MFRVANHDFCPSWNWLFYTLKEPVGWVVAAIMFSLLVGLLVGPQGYVLAIAFTALLVLGLAWPWLSMKGIRCSLVLPDRRVSENQDLVVLFRVKNYWPLPVFGMMVKGDFLQALNEADECVAFALRRIAAWSESEFRIPIKPRRRGRLPTGEVIVANGFPFGLIDISKSVARSTSVLVWPSCESLDGFPVSDSTRFSLHGALRDRSGNDGDSIGVRCYRNGDRLRNIHWAQTVRSQRLMVRERQTISSTDATVVLDLSPSIHAGSGIHSSNEWAIRIAASICSHLHESQSPVRVVCVGLPSLKQYSADNRSGLRAVMDFLADLPSLDAALESVESSCQMATSKQELSRAGRLFLIGTNLSSDLRKVNSSEFTPVVIDLEGFADRRLSGESNIVSNSDRSGDGIFIATPESAATQLICDWNRSFGDAI